MSEHPPLTHRSAGGVSLFQGKMLDGVTHLWLDDGMSTTHIADDFEHYTRQIDDCTATIARLERDIANATNVNINHLTANQRQQIVDSLNRLLAANKQALARYRAELAECSL